MYKNVKDKQKSNQMFRKAIELIDFYEHESEKTNLSYEDFYQNAIMYEFVYSLAMLYFSIFIGEKYNSNSLLFYRRFLECYAYYRPYEDKLFEKINFQVFKIQAQLREVGQKEGDKIKIALKLRKSNINSALKDNKFLFLHGIFASEFSYHNFMHELFGYKNKEIVFAYDYLSLRSHQTSFSIFNKFTDKMDKEVKCQCLDLYPKFLKDSLKDVKKLSKINLIDLFNDDKIEKQIKDFKETISNIATLLDGTVLNYISVMLFSIYDYLYSSIAFLKIGSYRGVVSSFKPFIEKIAVLNSLLRMNPSLANETFIAYNYCSVYTIKNSLCSTGGFEEGSFENNLDQIYSTNVKDRSNISFLSFKQAIIQNPSFVLTLKRENYSSSVERFIKENFVKDEEELLDSYFESVVLSHCDGFLLFKKDKNYTDFAKIIIHFTLDYLKYLFDYFYGNKIYYSLNISTDKLKIKDAQKQINSCIDNLVSLIKSTYFGIEEDPNKKLVVLTKNYKDYLD